MIVEVYRNLRDEIFSIRSPGGKVITRRSMVTLRDVKFIVQPAGREKVRREKRKNVHAFVKGAIILDIPKELNHFHVNKEWRQVTYNPYRNESFVDVETNEPIEKAEYVYMYYPLDGKPTIWYTNRKVSA